MYIKLWTQIVSHKNLQQVDVPGRMRGFSESHSSGRGLPGTGAARVQSLVRERGAGPLIIGRVQGGETTAGLREGQEEGCVPRNASVTLQAGAGAVCRPTWAGPSSARLALPEACSGVQGRLWGVEGLPEGGGAPAPGLACGRHPGLQALSVGCQLLP